MPGLYSSQGCAVSFAGESLGSLLSIDVKGQAGSPVDYTHMGSTVAGSGNDARTIRNVTVVSIEPTTVDIAFYGPPGYNVLNAAGTLSQLVITGNLSVNVYAILTSWGATATVGDFIKGTASFIIVGS